MTSAGIVIYVAETTVASSTNVFWSASYRSIFDPQAFSEILSDHLPADVSYTDLMVLMISVCVLFPEWE